MLNDKPEMSVEEEPSDFRAGSVRRMIVVSP